MSVKGQCIHVLWVAFSIMITISIANASPIADEWVKAVIRVESDSGVGTGFLVSREISEGSWRIFLVTNKHVVFGNNYVYNRSCQSLVLSMNITNDGIVWGRNFRVPLGDAKTGYLWRGHPNESIDVIAVDITDLCVNHPEIRRRNATYNDFATLDTIEREEITMGDDIVFIGYPNGTIVHASSNYPIVRQGIISSMIGTQIRVPDRSTTANRRVDAPGFYIDAGVIRGSSGSPVILKPVFGRVVRDTIQARTNDAYLLGIIADTVLTKARGDRTEDILVPAGLGVAFDASTIRETIELFFE